MNPNRKLIEDYLKTCCKELKTIMSIEDNKDYISVKFNCIDFDDEFYEYHLDISLFDLISFVYSKVSV